MVVEKLLVADLQKVSGSVERKICAVAVTNILCQLPSLYSQQPKLWLDTHCSIVRVCVARQFLFNFQMKLLKF